MFTQLLLSQNLLRYQRVALRIAEMGCKICLWVPAGDIGICCGCKRLVSLFVVKYLEFSRCLQSDFTRKHWAREYLLLSPLIAWAFHSYHHRVDCSHPVCASVVKGCVLKSPPLAMLETLRWMWVYLSSDHIGLMWDGVPQEYIWFFPRAAGFLPGVTLVGQGRNPSTVHAVGAMQALLLAELNVAQDTSSPAWTGK